MPIYTDNQGRSAASPASPRRSRPAACATSTRTSRPPTPTSTACRCSGRSRPTRWRRSSTPARPGRNLYDLADVNKRGAALVYQGTGTATLAPEHAVRRLQHPRQPGPVAVPRRDPRPRVAQARRHGAAVHREVHASATPRTTSARRSATRATTSTWATSTRSTRCSTTATPSSTSGTGCVFAGIWELPICQEHQGAPGRSWAAGSSTGSSPRAAGIPFTMYDCTNGLGLCMRAEDPTGIDRNATSGAGTGNPNEFSLLDLSPMRGGSRRLREPDHGQLGLRPVSGRHDRAQRLPRPGRLVLRPEHVQALPLRRPLRPAAAPRGLQRVQPRQHVRGHGERRREQLQRDHGLQGLHGTTAVRTAGDGQRRSRSAAKFEF